MDTMMKASNANPQQQIADMVVTHSSTLFRRGLKAIILTGSMARNEATCVEIGSSFHAHSDAEFLLLFHDDAALPSDTIVSQLCRSIRTELSRTRIECQIHMGAAHVQYLRNIKPHIYGYELRACGRVAWGEMDVLEQIPDFPARAIPREDAWRLLSNRIVEHLESLAKVKDNQHPMTDELRYSMVKLCLDVATSYLIFAGAYSPSYKGRQESLNKIAAENRPQDERPFPMAEFAEQTGRMTRWKLNPELG